MAFFGFAFVVRLHLVLMLLLVPLFLL